MEPRELVEELAKALVEKPEEVAVSELKGEQVTVIELKVAKEDIGKVIGRGGRIAMALRTILGAVSSKTKKNVLLEIID
ncbi:MAG: KH domain-containing protein [Desulfobacteraceae bacterium]|nr:MAG: KH domain-containing protein [Desulfobacteraceae bacterium]